MININDVSKNEDEEESYQLKERINSLIETKKRKKIYFNTNHENPHKYEDEIIDNYGFAWYNDSEITNCIRHDKNFENLKSLDLMINYYNVNSYIFYNNFDNNDLNKINDNNSYINLRYKQDKHWCNVRYEQAMKKFNQNNYDRALYYVNESLVFDPYSIDTLLLKAKILSIQGLNNKLTECYNEIVKLDSNYIIINNEIKRLDGKNIETKIDNKSRIINGNPLNSNIKLKLGKYKESSFNDLGSINDNKINEKIATDKQILNDNNFIEKIKVSIDKFQENTSEEIISRKRKSYDDVSDSDSSDKRENQLHSMIDSKKSKKSKHKKSKKKHKKKNK